jgi:hypothetical protein
MPGAAEPLSRSACSTRCECPGTPQAASVQEELRRRFWRCDHRPTAAICEDQKFRGVQHSGIIRTGGQCCNIELQILCLPTSKQPATRKLTRSDNQKRVESGFAASRISFPCLLQPPRLHRARWQLGPLNLMQKRNPGRGNCRGFLDWRLMSGGTSPTPTYGIEA